MPDSSTFLIKRRRVGSVGRPTALKNGELAYNEVNDVLYYGKGVDNANNATEIVPIGGRDIFTITYPVDTPESLVGGENTDFFTIPHNLRVLSWTLLSESQGSVLLDIQACRMTTTLLPTASAMAISRSSPMM